LKAAAAALGLALGLGCGAPATPPRPASSAAAGPAVLVAEPPTFDFGRVLPDRAVRKEFRLKNLGRDVVSIESVATDCGCMVVGEYARQLAPGASTGLTVQLHTPPQPGTLVRTLVVKTAGAQPTLLELRVRATVVGEGAGGA
jgi:hypothetical protein